MLIGKVVGNLISTVKIPAHNGNKLLLIKEIDESGNEKGSAEVALDCACAGVGDYVLFTKEGGTCKMALGDKKLPVDSTVIGVLDHLPAN